MGIEDIQISEELETNAPSIKYSGNEGPKSPQEQQQMMMAQLEEEYLKYVEDMLEQGMEPMSLQQFMEQAMAEGDMAGGNPLPQDPTKPVNPFAPKPTGPTLPNRQMAAYGGIMGLDGRKQYGLGSWFQENIMDPIKENPEIAAAALAAGANYYDIIPGPKSSKGYIGNILDNPTVKNILYGKEVENEKTGKTTRSGGAVDFLTENLIPIAGGAIAGLFTDKDQPGGQSGMPNDNTALQLGELKKTANILDQKQGMAAGLNFLPSVAARKYSPEEMIKTYATAANGGRIGYKEGGSVMTLMDGTKVQIPDGAYENGTFKDIIYSSDRGSLLREEVIRGLSFSQGGRIGRAEGGIMDLGGMEKDYRAEGGFVPIGREEKADDVPARLSVNEFVFTADAVRSAGGGDIDQGAKVMENMMKHLEAGGQVSEESQGLGGAREMFATSQRLGDVI